MMSHGLPRHSLKSCVGCDPPIHAQGPADHRRRVGALATLMCVALASCTSADDTDSVGQDKPEEVALVEQAESFMPCSNSLFSNPQCCAIDALGVVALDCTGLSRMPSSLA